MSCLIFIYANNIYECKDDDDNWRKVHLKPEYSFQYSHIISWYKPWIYHQEYQINGSSRKSYESFSTSSKCICKLNFMEVSAIPNKVFNIEWNCETLLKKLILHFLILDIQSTYNDKLSNVHTYPYMGLEYIIRNMRVMGPLGFLIKVLVYHSIFLWQCK